MMEDGNENGGMGECGWKRKGVWLEREKSVAGKGTQSGRTRKNRERLEQSRC